MSRSKLYCPYYLDGCSKRFRNQSGRTYHVRSAHRNNNIILNDSDASGLGPGNEILQDHNHEPLVEGDDEHGFMDAEHDDDRPSTPASPTQPEAPNVRVHPPTPQRNFHPHLNGKIF